MSKLDNAMSHKTKDVESKLCEVVGLVDDFDPPHRPDERAIVETFLHYFVDYFSHRVLGKTGARPKDEIIKRLAPKGGDLFLLLTLEASCEPVKVPLTFAQDRPCYRLLVAALSAIRSR